MPKNYLFTPLLMLFLVVAQLLPHRFWALAFALLGGVAASPARAQDSTLTRLIRQHQWPLTQLRGQFAGPGWEQLRAAIGQSQFVLVGENHGLAQISGFTAAVAQELKPTVFAAEVDAYLAQDLTALGAQPGPPTAYLRQYPEALSFYSWAEEFDLVRTLRAQHVQVWGLDQVFGATAARFYARLAEQAQGTAARTYLRQRAATYQAQGLAFERRGHNEWSMSAQAP